MKRLLTILPLILAGNLFGTLTESYSPEQYNTDGDTTGFNISWRFFDEEDDLIVTHTDSDGNDTVLTYGAGAGKYTIYAPNSDYSSGATLTAGTEYPSGGRITIEREVDYDQDLSINGDFVPAKPLETQLDKIVAQIQQIKDIGDRVVSVPSSDVTPTLVLPNSADRADKLLGFDESGDAVAVDYIDSGTIVAGDAIDVSASNAISVDFDGTTITTNGSAQLTVIAVPSGILEAGSVVSSNILDGTITTDDIADGTITTDDIENLSTNISTASQTNFVTEGAVKNYVDDTLTDYACFNDTKASGVNGGASSAGWNQRDINTTNYNGITGCSLSSNTITLPAGSYQISASSVAYQSLFHQLCLFAADNAPGDGGTSNVLFNGTSEVGDTGNDDSPTRSMMTGVLVLGAETGVEMWHYCAQSDALGLGPGHSNGLSSNVYSEIEFRKLP